MKCKTLEGAKWTQFAVIFGEPHGTKLLLSVLLENVQGWILDWTSEGGADGFWTRGLDKSQTLLTQGLIITGGYFTEPTFESYIQ